jgi:hypothetical protein
MEEHFWRRGLTPTVEITAASENCAGPVQRLQRFVLTLCISSPRQRTHLSRQPVLIVHSSRDQVAQVVEESCSVLHS